MHQEFEIDFDDDSQGAARTATAIKGADPAEGIVTSPEESLSGSATGIEALEYLRVAATRGCRCLEFGEGRAQFVAHQTTLLSVTVREYSGSLLVGDDALRLFGALYGPLQGPFRISPCIRSSPTDFGYTFDRALLTAVTAADEWIEQAKRVSTAATLTGPGGRWTWMPSSEG